MSKRILSLFRNLFRKRAIEQALDDELLLSLFVCLLAPFVSILLCSPWQYALTRRSDCRYGQRDEGRLSLRQSVAPIVDR